MTQPAAQTDCVACGARIAAGPDACPVCSAPAFSPQRRVVAVLFADLTGYTELCAQMDAEDVHLLIRPVMNALCQVCQTLGGVVSGIAGDGFLAVFGARTAHEHDPLRAVVAAARLQRVVQTRRRAYPRLPELRVGIHAGEVLVAPSWEPGGFTASGDVVNVGQRLCAAAPPGGVLVSADAAALTSGISAWSADEPQLLHKRSGPVPARLLDWAALPERLSTARLPSAVPLVGRVAELARLDALVTAPDGAAAVVVLGDPGAGKTRLVDDWAARHPDLRRLASSCPSFGASDLVAWRELVVSALAEPDAELAVRRLPPGTQRRLRRLLSGGEDVEASDEAELLAAGVSLLRELATLRPTLVFLDDLHWSAGSVVSALHLLRDVSGAGLVVVGTSRLDDPRLAGLPQLAVGALPPQDAATVAERYLPGAPKELLDVVLTRAGGNPLFIEQCATLLLEDGTVRIGEDGCHVAAGVLTSSRIPTSMRLFVSARLDLLEAAERTALAAAATLGDVVELDALAHLAPAARPAVDGLVARGLLRWRTAAEGADQTLEFGHALVRDVAYAAQTRGDRRAAHERNAQWYARRDDIEALELRARHLEAAVELLTSTGDECDLVRRTFDALVAQAETGMIERLRSSRSALARARGLLDGHPTCSLDLLQFWLATSRSASIGGDAETALDAAGRAGALAADSGDMQTRAEVGLARADALLAKVDPPAASNAYRVAQSLFVAAGDSVGEARAALGQALCADVSTGARDAVVALENARAVGLAAGFRAVALVAAQELALLSYIDGPIAVAAAVDAAEALIDRGDELGHARMSLARSGVTLHGHDAPAAASHAAAAVRRASDLGDALTLFNGLLLLLEAQVLSGRLQEAFDTLGRCLDIARGRPTRRMHVSTQLIAALLHVRRGDPAAAAAAIDEVSDEAGALGLAFRRDLSAFRCYVALERGWFSEAVDHASATTTLDGLLDQPFLSLRPRLASLAACVGARTSPADDAAALRSDAQRMGAQEIDALAARWLAQDALLRGHPPPRVPPPPDVVEARALDLENDGLTTGDRAAFGAAADAWRG
ncbi:MAG: AAA family ATPase, partial [Mycobacteriales bacterium]